MRPPSDYALNGLSLFLSDESLLLGSNSLTAFYWQTGSSPGQSRLLSNAQVDSLENNPWRSYNSFKSSCYDSSHEQCKQAYFNSQSLTGLQRQYLNLIIDAGGGIDTVSLRYNEIQIVVCASTI